MIGRPLRSPGRPGHSRRVTRILAICLLIFGLLLPLAPTGSEAAQAGHGEMGMTDCAECETGAPLDRMGCGVTGMCLAPTAITTARATETRFAPRARTLPRFSDAVALAGLRPAPIPRPPRHLS